MNAQDQLDSLNKLQRSHEREIDELNASKRDHHKSWDAHVITLSMASIGFAFVSLPLGAGSYPLIAYFSLFCFVLAIISALLGFLFADKSFDLSIGDNSDRTILTQNAINYHKEYCKDKNILNENEEYEYRKTISDIFGQRKANVAKPIGDYNNKIRITNHAKTWFFIFGVIMLSVYAIVNDDMLGSNKPNPHATSVEKSESN
jgi:hypothetical protein